MKDLELTEAQWDAAEPGLQVLADMLMEAAIVQRSGPTRPTVCELPRDHPAIAAGRVHRDTSTALRIEVIAAYRGKCAKCGEPGAEVDHIAPQARGGLTVRENLQLLCVPCHRKKTKADFAQ